MNSIKKYLTSLPLCLTVMLATISCQAAQPGAQKQTTARQTAAVPAKTDSVQPPSRSNTKIIVYYFHGNARCPTCYLLENYAKSEVETSFADAIKGGKLEWKTVNVDDKGNEHFADDYKLYTKSVIVSTMKDGKESTWKNLEKVWQLVGDQSTYRDYIRKEVKACLEGKCL